MVRRLLLLNGLAILGVVLNHTVGWGFIALIWWADRYSPVAVPSFAAVGSFDYWLLRAGEGLAAFAVPAFLFVSGYFAAFALSRAVRAPETNAVRAPTALGLTAQTASVSGVWSIVGSRIKMLVIPYLLWSAVYLVLDATLGSVYAPISYARRIAFGGAAAGFYYVPLLIQYYLLAPFLVLLAQRRWKWLLAGALILQLTAILAIYLKALAPTSTLTQALDPLTPAWFFPGMCFWFAIGIIAGTHVAPFRTWVDQVHRMVLIATPVMFVAGMVEWETLTRAAPAPWTGQFRTLSDEFYSGAIILAFLGGGALAPHVADALQKLGVRSFGIYLVHTLGIIIAAKAISRLLPGLLPHQLLLQPLLIAATLIASLGLMWLVDHSPFRRYYRYIFG